MDQRYTVILSASGVVIRTFDVLGDAVRFRDLLDRPQDFDIDAVPRGAVSKSRTQSGQ